MDIRFDMPWMLGWAGLAIPLGILGWRAMGGMDLTRKVVAVGLRGLLVAGLAVGLARPRVVREHDHLTVIGVLDVSGSVRVFGGRHKGTKAQRHGGTEAIPGIGTKARRHEGIEASSERESGEDIQGDSLVGEAHPTSSVDWLRGWFRAAVEGDEGKIPEDRVGLVVFDGESVAIAVPTRGEYGDDNIDLVMAEGTDIAGALEFAGALFPPDAGRRLVLATDGNETTGDVLEAVSKLGVVVDVLPVAYLRRGDVAVVRVEAPPRSRPGERVRVRVVLESTAGTSGVLSLFREGEEVDINGAEIGGARRILVPAGRSVQTMVVRLDERPLHRFRAVFEPDEVGQDAVGTNNEAESFTVTEGKGAVLIVRTPGNGGDSAGGSDHLLARWLEEAEVPVEVKRALEFPNDLLSLQQFDLVVLDNVPAYALTREQHALIRRYVEDLGGGLVMIGGPRSFGAGGWNGTEVEKALPVEMDPPQELRAPTAALVLILDKSGSMNRRVAGARASQQEVANRAAALAIESLRSESLVGVLAFDYGVEVVVPLQRNSDPKRLAKLVMGIRAEGGTDLAPALRTALSMLKGVEADKKRVVCLSDGQSESGVAGLERVAAEMLANDIQLTTIAVGDDADVETLNKLAKLGGGVFHTVRNPRMLPRVLVDSVQSMNAPLIKEGVFRARVLPTGSTLTAGIDAAPALRGMVVTAVGDDPRHTVELVHEGESGEPLLVLGQIGLGRGAAFMSDLGGPWSSEWVEWAGARPFWLQLIRMTARPERTGTMELWVEARGDQLRMVLEAGPPEDSEAESMDYLEVTGTAYSPSGKSIPVKLRQTGPGRYEGVAAAGETGNYIVAISPRRGARRLAPLIAGATRAGGAEYRRMESNMELLEEIVKRSGGRRLEGDDPAAVSLFNRAGLPVSVSALPVWPWVLWVVLGIFLLDVACRRLAWSGAKVAERVRRGWRMVGARDRGRVVELGGLRAVSAELESRWEESSRSPEYQSPKSPESSVVMEVEEESASLDREPATIPIKSVDPERARRVLDAMQGREADRSERNEDEVISPDAGDREDEGGDMTAKLLEAKRRARERRGE